MSYLILIVDDDESMRTLRRSYLERLGYGVVEACDVDEGVEAAVRERPRLILMNFLMHKMDGLRATRLIHQQPGLERTPVIMSSACDKKEMRDVALAAGCVEYIEEPSPMRELVEKIEAHILIG